MKPTMHPAKRYGAIALVALTLSTVGQLDPRASRRGKTGRRYEYEAERPEVVKH